MVLHLKLFSVERGVLLVTLVSLLLNCLFLLPFIRGYKKLEKTVSVQCLIFSSTTTYIQKINTVK